MHYGVKIPASLDFVCFSDAFNVQKWPEQERNERQLIRFNTSPLYHNHPPLIYEVICVASVLWEMDYHAHLYGN